MTRKRFCTRVVLHKSIHTSDTATSQQSGAVNTYKIRLESWESRGSNYEDYTIFCSNYEEYTVFWTVILFS